MKTGVNEARTWEDIIFEDRNHEYGAYAVRKSYPSNVNRATTVTLGLAAAIAAYSFIARTEPTAPEVVKPIPYVGPTQPPDIIQNKLPETPVRTQQRKAGDLPPVAVADPIVDVVLPDEPIAYQGGDAIGGDDVSVEGTPGATAIEPVVEAPPVEVVETIYLTPEVAASYKGGMEAMAKFVSRNLRYPPIARRMGIEGTVFIAFIVGKSGEILDATVIKGIHPACDAEALRVVNLMKDWSAGMQGGVPVKVRMVLPIKFKLSQ